MSFSRSERAKERAAPIALMSAEQRAQGAEPQKGSQLIVIVDGQLIELDRVAMPVSRQSGAIARRVGCPAVNPRVIDQEPTGFAKGQGRQHDLASPR